MSLGGSITSATTLLKGHSRSQHTNHLKERNVRLLHEVKIQRSHYKFKSDKYTITQNLNFEGKERQ